MKKTFNNHHARASALRNSVLKGLASHSFAGSRGLPALRAQARQAGFTLIETLAAIMLITMAIIAPMALTVQALSTAYYARDQIVASNLAQEGIEMIRGIRDDYILSNAEGNTADILGGILANCEVKSGHAGCYVDATSTVYPPTITSCGSTCPVLNTSGRLGLYAYTTGSGWIPSNFTRTITVALVRSDPTTSSTEEVKVTSTVSWKTANFKSQSVTLSENLYNWVAPGSGT